LVVRTLTRSAADSRGLRTGDVRDRGGEFPDFKGSKAYRFWREKRKNKKGEGMGMGGEDGPIHTKTSGSKLVRQKKKKKARSGLQEGTMLTG